METSSLNLLLRKQSSQHSQLPPRDSHPALVLFQNILRTNWRGFLGLALLPLTGALWVLLLQRGCRGCLGIQGLSQFPAKAAALPRALGCRGHSQPWPHSLTPSKAKSQTGFHWCPNNHFTNCSLKKSIFRFTHLFLSSVEFSQHKNLSCTSAEKIEPKWCRAGAWEQHQGVSKAAAAQRSLQYRKLSCRVTGNVEVVLSSVFLLALLLFISYFLKTIQNVISWVFQMQMSHSELWLTTLKWWHWILNLKFNLFY